MADQGDALRGKVAEVDGVASVSARDQRKCPIRPTLFDRRLIEAELAQPPDEIAAAIAPWHAAMPSNRKENAPPLPDKLFSDLRAGGARTDHEHRAGRKLIRIEVFARVHLIDAADVPPQFGSDRRLIGAGRHD